MIDEVSNRAENVPRAPMVDVMDTLRELVRHLLFVSNLNQVIYLYREIKGHPSRYLRHDDLAERFAEIYRENKWVERPDNPKSGAGSTLDATMTVRSELPVIFRKLGIRTLVDVGCGDFAWMHEVKPLPRYIGIDIVEPVIIENRKKYGDQGVSFLCLDATKAAIPRCDAILCREVLFHLSFADIKSLLLNVTAAGARYFMATTDDDVRFNANIASGDFRNLNLKRAPMRFPAPIIEIPDTAVRPHRKLAVWKTADLTR